MKRVKRYILALSAIAILGFTSCNDYLEVEPVGQVIPNKVSEYRALLTEGYRAYPATGRAYTSLLSDEFGMLDSYQFWSGTADIDPMFQWEYTNPLMREFEWQSYYKSIFQSLAVLDGIDAADQDSAESKNQIKGEALALRAYNHFELCNLYGKWYNPSTAATDKAVPLSLEIDIEQRYIPTTVAKVYESVVADLEQAIALMDVEQQLPSETYMYRFSKLSARALLARVKLYQQKWQEAYDIATSIIGQVRLLNMNQSGIMNDNLPWERTSVESLIALDTPFNGANGDLIYGGIISDAIVAKFQDGDLRKNYLKNVYGQYKLNRRSSAKVSIRAAEVYLIAAEATANIPSLNNEAKSLLSTLCENRFTLATIDAKKSAIAMMSQQELIDEVASQRAVELIGEGHRWFDLRRTNRSQIIKEVLDMNTFESKTFTLNANDPRYTLPYPRSAVEANPDLSR